VLKATIASVLAAAAALALAGCGAKQETASTAAAPTTAAPAAEAPQMPVNHPPAQPTGEVDLAGIAKADGGLTVAEVYADKDKLGSQPVTVRGKVVKTNAGIMGKDWLHVRDGSGAEGTNDLTVTTSGGTLPKVGDTVVVKGTVALNQDFGMGYQYPVLLENAQVTIE
jgi:type IV pilus biogenesis protein CpaD/CtpE